MLAVYTYLVAAGDVPFNDPIAKYVPELAVYASRNAANLESDPIDYFDWKSVIIGALASRMSGNPSNFACNPKLQAFGLPPVPVVNTSFLRQSAGFAHSLQ